MAGPLETKFEKVAGLMTKLGIPFKRCCQVNDGTYYDANIRMLALYDILMDEEKLRELVSTLKLKAFW
jgi:hypothetical protein